MVIVSWCSGGNSLAIVGGGVSGVSMGVGERGGHVGDHTNIVGVASGVSVVDRETGSNLEGGVGLGLSLPLAVVDTVVHGRDSSGVGVDSGGSVGVDSPVANGADSRDEAMAVVDTSDDAAIGVAAVDLAQCVGLTADGGNKGKNLERKTNVNIKWYQVGFNGILPGRRTSCWQSYD